MPLHDWTDRLGWDGVHQLWNVELLRWIKPRLPEGYRAYLGTVPALGIDQPHQNPDVHVRNWLPTPQGAGAPSPAGTDSPSAEEPDEQIAVATLEPQVAIQVVQEERLIACVEVVSPRNKDRPESRTAYTGRYVGYLLQGVHLLLVDVHRRRLPFSFADAIAQALAIAQPPLPPPFAVSYRVGPPAATGGRLLAVWRRPLTIGAEMPTIPLPLSDEVSVTVDLEQTYMRAAADAYLT
jgi:hypothetical protein